MPHDLSSNFHLTYAQARDAFLAQAAQLQRPARSTEHPLRGAQGEVLAIDVSVLGPPDAQALLVVSSGMHGIEGFCGSACQLALMRDADLQARLASRGVALALVHAVNPHGFSYRRRTNEDNIDLNRNFLDFTQPLPENTAYAEIHALVLPQHWPPDEANAAAIEAFRSRHGELYWRDALSSGQGSHPDGLFYFGRQAAWSNLALRETLRQVGQGRRRIAWIDIHTGLGPFGHGEKIFAAYDERLPLRHDPTELARARRYWGADVFSILEGQSASRNARGGGVTCLALECPHAETTHIGLEFGTLAREQVSLALRGSHWLRQHPEAPDELARRITQHMVDAFCPDSAEWRGMVIAQTRVMVLQAIAGLAAA